MDQKTFDRGQVKKMLSKQLDQEIQKLKSENVSNKNTEVTNMTPFDLLQQKLRRLQQKLQKVKDSDSRYIFRQRKNSSSNNSKNSTNRNFHQDKKQHNNYDSIQSHNRSKNQKSPQQNSNKKKSFTVEKDHIVESHLTNNGRKIFKSDKKYPQDEIYSSRKNQRVVSGKIDAHKPSKQNSKLSTPNKKKRVVTSAKNKTTSNNLSDQKNLSTKKINKEHESQAKSVKKKVNSTSKKEHYVIESEYESGFKLVSKNINSSESKLKKKSLTSMSQNNIFLSSKRKEEQNIKDAETNRNEETSSRKKKHITNFEEKILKKHLSYNAIHQNLINFSRQPMIPLKQKIHIEKQLKQKSRQNLKLKEQLGKLHKYEEEYWKMKEIFQKFEKERRFHKNKK